MRPVPVAILMAIGVLTAACGQDTRAPSAMSSPAATATVSKHTETVVDRFIDAANHGDVAVLRGLFAPDARFDRAGTVFEGKEIVNDFLEPDVTDADGRYHETRRRAEGDRLTVTFTFDTGSGGQERFTYSFLVRDGRIADVVGRYL
ncbi:nuclear transport factor 2 family protein [Nonomuraea dietziae]|uniref:nuclear transport factor 2 family protein n=1 Tax=Nonomuraea dietziae TaxID=65515 RepID=UPI0033E89243